MARTIPEIQAQMDAEQALQTGLSGLNSPSQSAIYTLWKYITSASINLFEQLLDIFKTEIETIVYSAPIGTNQWLKSKALEFQYSATTPQVVAVASDYTIAYNPIDTDLQIITRCSVKTLSNQNVSVKVAKSDPPTALSATELNSFKGYLTDICFAGIQYNAISVASDKLYVQADIYYNGQYASVISANVIAGLNSYMANIPFDGYVRISAIEDAIQNVTGVTDVVIKDVAIRSDTTLLANATQLVQLNAVIFNKYPTYAGYVVQEDTPTYTYSDTLNFIVES